MEELSDLPVLRSLDLSENRNLTDAGLSKLRGLPQLVELSLSSSNVTGRGLEALKDLRNLTRLNLSYCTRLDNAAMKTLQSLGQLEFLDLKGCLGVTHAGVNRLQRKGLNINR